jgi:hypothetical protein
MFRAPRPAQIPHLHSLLDNIGGNDADLAKFLDISHRTLGGYRSKGQVPRGVAQTPEAQSSQTVSRRQIGYGF